MYLHSSPPKLNKTHIGASSGFLTKVVITQDKMSSRISFNEMSNFSTDTKLTHVRETVRETDILFPSFFFLSVNILFNHLRTENWF